MAALRFAPLSAAAYTGELRRSVRPHGVRPARLLSSVRAQARDNAHRRSPRHLRWRRGVGVRRCAGRAVGTACAARGGVRSRYRSARARSPSACACVSCRLPGGARNGCISCGMVCTRVRNGRSQPRSGACGGDRACHVVSPFSSAASCDCCAEGEGGVFVHKKSGFLALVGVVIVLGVIEIVVVHLLVSRFSVVAAAVLTAVSIYGLAWLGSFARSVVACPILVGEGRLTATWGFLPGVDVPLASLDRVVFADPGFEKDDVLDLATMGAKPCWVVLCEPVEVCGMTRACTSDSRRQN